MHWNSMWNVCWANRTPWPSGRSRLSTHAQEACSNVGGNKWEKTIFPFVLFPDQRSQMAINASCLPRGYKKCAICHFADMHNGHLLQERLPNNTHRLSPHKGTSRFLPGPLWNPRFCSGCSPESISVPVIHVLCVCVSVPVIHAIQAEPEVVFPCSRTSGLSPTYVKFLFLQQTYKKPPTNRQGF